MLLVAFVKPIFAEPLDSLRMLTSGSEYPVHIDARVTEDVITTRSRVAGTDRSSSSELADMSTVAYHPSYLHNETANETQTAIMIGNEDADTEVDVPAVRPRSLAADKVPSTRVGASHQYLSTGWVAKTVAETGDEVVTRYRRVTEIKVRPADGHGRIQRGVQPEQPEQVGQIEQAGPGLADDWSLIWFGVAVVVALTCPISMVKGVWSSMKRHSNITLAGVGLALVVNFDMSVATQTSISLLSLFSIVGTKFGVNFFENDFHPDSERAKGVEEAHDDDHCVDDLDDDAWAPRLQTPQSATTTSPTGNYEESIEALRMVETQIQGFSTPLHGNHRSRLDEAADRIYYLRSVVPSHGTPLTNGLAQSVWIYADLIQDRLLNRVTHTLTTLPPTREQITRRQGLQRELHSIVARCG